MNGKILQLHQVNTTDSKSLLGGAEGGIPCESVKKMAEMSKMSKKKLKCQHTPGNVCETQ